VTRRGFTLVEVLVALFIVALGMAALLGTMSSAAESTVFLRDKTFASWIAQNRITELRLQVALPAEGRSEGQVEYAGRSWRWEQEVRELDIPGLRRIDVRVRPTDAPAPKRVGARPAWTADLSGVMGDAVAPRNGTVPDWNGEPFPGTNLGGAPAADPSADPSAPPTPAPAPAPTPTPGAT
jgi:general secretion pathway protein I